MPSYSFTSTSCTPARRNRLAAARTPLPHAPTGSSAPATNSAGNPFGTFAAPEEALEAIIDKYPMKDRILKAPDGGSGSHPNSAYAPGAKIIPKGDMSTFGANLEAIAKGEVTVAAQ